MSLESLFLRIDRLAGGRDAHLTVPEESRSHPKTLRAFRWIMGLLAFELVLGVAAVVFALILLRRGETVHFAVWMRSLVVLGITSTLFYFAWRAARGWRWAYQRLRLFAQIFPVITLVLAAIPNLYPAWMVTEQIVFSLVMIGVADFLTSDHMRAAYRKPETAQA
ncbi:hypothetical protein RN607_09745 [Demequina capsici]|uniref:Uncharacterized protein n=1 Tax=Demequina capsici TaxID=3075620 RepID=A0AA96F499_9MICO|nr:MULTISPECIES: hypothetical protein [unclassified Demequina]WNM23643.1 hypothetical protein RN606_09745 [Demequina sp. OYTSA14]WNM26482.1 hypothetical protein RN607_09745 [Demequina sp. PMTSA13]